MQDRVTAQAGLEGAAELLERLAGREAGGLDPRLAAVAVARVDLGLEQCRGEALERPLPSRARSASFGSARAAAGALRTRNRCASSDEARVMRSARRRRPTAGPRSR